MLPCIIHFIIHNPRPCSIRSLYLRFFRGISAPSLLACLPCQFFDSQIVIRFNSLGSIGLTTMMMMMMMMISPQTLYRTCTYFYVFKIKKWRRLQGLLLRDWSPPGSRRSGGPHTTAMEGSGFYFVFFFFGLFFYVFVFVIIKLKVFVFFKPVNKWAARRSWHITDPGEALAAFVWM